MTIKEIYDLLGADYDGVVARMCGEARVIKFVPKFLADPTYNELIEGFETENWELAFRAAHTMKGVCSNFGFTKLQNSSSDLCEMLRPGVYNPDGAAQLEIVKADYQAVADALAQLDA